MTIVVKILFEGSCLLIGDNLISGEELDNEIFVPTRGSIYNIIPQGSGWSVRGLKKKINVLDNNIIIGWYGNAIAAKSIIRELRRKNAESHLSFYDINNFFSLENIKAHVGDYIINDPVGFTGAILDKDEVLDFDFFTGTQNSATEISLSHGIGTIKLYGSGSADFYNYLSSILQEIENEICQSHDLSHLVHCLYLRISSNFLVREILSDSTITPSYYGGYYDFAALSNGNLLERKEHTYFFWNVVADSSGNPEAFLQAQGIKTQYLAQDIIQCLRWTTSSLSSPIVNAELYYISPIDMNKNELIQLVPSLEIHHLDFNSEYSCHFFVIRDPHGDSGKQKSIICTIKAEPNSDKHPVRIMNLGSKIKYCWNKEYAAYIENIVSEMWKRM